MNKVVVIGTGKEEYAIPLQYVVSIEKLEGITPIPQMPDYVTGMIEIRQQVIPILDLEFIFYDRFIQLDENSRLVIVQLEQFMVGILVNEAKEIIEISPEKIKQIGLIKSPATAYLTGVASLNGFLVTIINPEVLIGSLEGINVLLDELKSHC
ncbi:chemotaxis protein CheW [Neobacillus sp. PS3-12]|jgi:purine-binding chemotaxis protein CheW|uniref:chemotaxis protein CheW n=1 Tax=Neobacillus sp. PS3-12 TaxID=3070677 RepID=UPI0027E005CD|nr:chemotaxis protein CheW [Neobacillus sp. PS3-12]WML53972.1 chemotaxis protein CheW [Neobacillus sp. PS3-12]